MNYLQDVCPQSRWLCCWCCGSVSETRWVELLVWKGWMMKYKPHIPGCDDSQRSQPTGRWQALDASRWLTNWQTPFNSFTPPSRWVVGGLVGLCACVFLTVSLMPAFFYFTFLRNPSSLLPSSLFHFSVESFQSGHDRYEENHII